MRMGRRAEARFVQLKESYETKDYCARNRLAISGWPRAISNQQGWQQVTM